MNKITENNEEYGTITINLNAIRQLIFATLQTYSGKLYLTNSKGKQKMNIYKNEDIGNPNDIDVEIMDEDVDIKIYMIMRFGVIIKKTSEKIMDAIAEQLELALGHKPKRITIYITGVFSKKIAKRDIKVIKEYV